MWLKRTHVKRGYFRNHHEGNWAHAHCEGAHEAQRGNATRHCPPSVKSIAKNDEGGKNSNNGDDEQFTVSISLDRKDWRNCHQQVDRSNPKRDICASARKCSRQDISGIVHDSIDT